MKKQILTMMAAGFMAAMTSCEDNGGMNPMYTTAMVYASNNANGEVTLYEYENNSMATTTTYESSSSAADGVYYDASSDQIFQVSRSDKGIEGFSADASVSVGGLINVNISIDGPNDMESPREMAVKGNFYVVADNADVDGDSNTPDGRFFVYQKSGNSFMLRNVITTDIKLWGITFIGDDLYAVVDTDNELAVYTDFLSNSSTGMLTTSKRVAIEGLVRTHGLTYDAASNTMVMTDIGQASNGQDDGGFYIIENFMSKFDGTANGGMISASETIIVSGSNTMMGNPVDVAYDGATKTVFIAEAGNGGGLVLSFANVTSGGNIAPSTNYNLESASSVYLHKM
ncbi:hypothetical protein [Jiulongibacter sediminis]|jgi:hypothetical protein|uniref:hypothetical protein n=1 Tax=Jiulongibacter sediminis TaxID=1605367 RepID=UPI0026ECA9C3|nr:hypothetical protein [Jiulongibacter sediminis]